MARWSLLVQQYDFDIQHRPGIVHGNADALSRRPYAPSSHMISAYDVPGVQIERVRDFQRRDPDLADLIQNLESSKLPDKDGIARSLLLTIDDYFLSEDGLLFHIWTPKGRRRTATHQQLVIPAALRSTLLWNFTITISRIMLLLTILYLFHLTSIVNAQEDSSFTDYDLIGKRVTFYPHH